MISKSSKKRYKYEEKHRTVNGVKQKRCTKCRRWREESEFYRDARHRDGLSSWCRQCERKRGREIRRKGGKSLKRYYTFRESHRVVDGIKQKRCRRCGKWKPQSEFHRRRCHKDGLDYWCRRCANAASVISRRQRLASQR